MAFFGAATAFVESTLAQIYKQRIDGELQGGVPYYLEKVTQKRWLGLVAAVTALTLYALLAPGVQATNIGVAAEFGLGMRRGSPVSSSPLSSGSSSGADVSACSGSSTSSCRSWPSATC